MRSTLLGLFLASLTWLQVEAVSAQPKQAVPPDSSHIPIPRRPGQDLEKLFEERFGRAMTIDELAPLLEKLPPQLREQLLRGLKSSDQDWNELRQQLAELAKHPDLRQDKLTPEQIEKLRQLVQQKLPKLPMGDPKLPITPPITPKTSPSDLDRPPTAAAEPEPGDDADKIMRWLSERFEGLAEQVEDSPALQRMLRELSEDLLNDTNEPGGADQPSAFGDWLRELRGGPFDLPDIDWNVPDSDALTAPSVPDSIAATSFWPVLAWVLVVALLVWAFWKVALPRLGLGVASAWKLGPWPVRPEAIASREELVRGFEYLSLLKFGLPAQSWNHLEVARRLGNAPAERLAGLYEVARYAPDHELLSNEQLAHARKDLCTLARLSDAGRPADWNNA